MGTVIYRIHYTSSGKIGSDEQIQTIEAQNDEEAIKAYNAFKAEKEAGNGQYYYSFYVKRLVRVDQIEKTTRIQ